MAEVETSTVEKQVLIKIASAEKEAEYHDAEAVAELSKPVDEEAYWEKEDRKITVTTTVIHDLDEANRVMAEAKALEAKQQEERKRMEEEAAASMARGEFPVDGVEDPNDMWHQILDAAPEGKGEN